MTGCGDARGRLRLWQGKVATTLKKANGSVPVEKEGHSFIATAFLGSDHLGEGPWACLRLYLR